TREVQREASQPGRGPAAVVSSRWNYPHLTATPVGFRAREIRAGPAAVIQRSAKRRSKEMEAAPEGFVYVAGFLSAAEQAALLRELRALDYQQDVFRGQRLKRRYAQFGYAYVSTGRKLQASNPLPEFLQAVIDKAMGHCPAGAVFNQCI